MLRLTSAFVVLFGAAVAVTTLLPTPALHALPVTSAAQAAASDTDAVSVRADKAVRVVYPPSDGTAKITGPATVAPDQSVAAQSLPAMPVVAPAAPVVLPEAAVIGAKLDINTASVEALDNMAGAGHIGRTIVQHRPYRSVEDLVGKRVIRKSVYDRIKDQVASQ
ncbi:helix-hairpin-helix domain-containing protein [Lichenihabitans sp. Uapishka_5]|uniref:ComEA family DNA-binding protein n=1 Tax=Lichenihabitans sp. Uapishka_5 TaxID=3037302 RepID=UPI0029E812CA|nr:helix-hairpin-helix domain-containing protein [Lichenihabitans sp. Uapishka_5]MDX7953623.1 helix-hairpin-helix domain-containing protein [Lichenihabitans sp. Uapishka_5]